MPKLFIIPKPKKFYLEKHTQTHPGVVGACALECVKSPDSSSELAQLCHAGHRKLQPSDSRIQPISPWEKRSVFDITCAKLMLLLMLVSCSISLFSGRQQHKVNHILRDRGTIKVVCIMQNCFILRKERSLCLSQGSTSGEIAFTMSNNSRKFQSKKLHKNCNSTYITIYSKKIASCLS